MSIRRSTRYDKILNITFEIVLFVVYIMVILIGSAHNHIA